MRKNTQFLTRLRSLFTAKGKTGSSPKQASAPPQASPSWSIYRSITEIPLSRWIDLTVDGYLRALVREGEPPEAETAAAYEDLRIQYADAMGDGEYRLYCDLIKEVTRLQIKLAQIENLIEVSREAFHPVIGQQIGRLLNRRFTWTENRAEIDKNLDLAWRSSRSIKIHIDLKSARLEALRSKYEGGGGAITREYYMSLLISLSDEAGFQLPDTISVWEFCERIRRANKRAELLTMQKKKANG